MDGSQLQPRDQAKIQAFLSDLTELSRKHGLAIGDEPVIFNMEYEDQALSYSLSDESKLFLGSKPDR